MSSIERELVITSAQVGERIDKTLAQSWPDFSRSRLQQWVESGNLLLNGAVFSPRQKARLGDHLLLRADPESRGEWLPESVAFPVVYEDSSIIVINKPADMVVHPAAGNWSGTLVNGLLYRYPELAALPRAGIVHRLDKDTTGVMVVARSIQAHFHLVQALQAREMKREYRALAFGKPNHLQFVVDEPIARHPRNRLKMAVVAGGRSAKTHFRVNQRIGPVTLFDVRLETGRTHQIRVHLSHAGLPILGDELYGGNNDFSRKMQWARQALHARKLTLRHPETGRIMVFEGGMPSDFNVLLECLHEQFHE